jgi:aldehyde dehydrogenase (NAD+)
MFDFTRRRPYGVAGLVTAWNSPIALLANKLPPALATGNTVVIKPSEHASVTTCELALLAAEAGFPPGVVNVVTGDAAVGDALTGHPGIGKISFTGGSATGTRVAEAAARRLVPVTLELGGKSPNIVFADADLDRAVVGAVAGIFGAAGQTCIAGSRLLVHRPVYERVTGAIVERAEAIRLGDPLDPGTEMGPVANRPQFDRILSLIEAGRGEGAALLAGGGPAEGLGDGLFIRPTVFGDVAPEMRVAAEEIFGPVLSIIPFDDEDEAVRIANDIDYGLAAGVWTRDIDRAHRVTERLEAGSVWVNTYRATAAQAPFGGLKRSGYGRERGEEALAEYTYVQNVMIDYSGAARDPFSIRT